MARSGRSGGGSRPARAGAPVSRRPTVPASNPAPTQTRSATTSAYPGKPAGPPAAPGQAAGVPAVSGAPAAGGGMMSNIISTGMGVALGHQISNGISSMFGGGSAEPPAADAPPPASELSTQGGAAQNSWGQATCDADVKQFTKCMDDNRGNMDICGWYLSQLKACQQAAKEY